MDASPFVQFWTGCAMIVVPFAILAAAAEATMRLAARIRSRTPRR